VNPSMTGSEISQQTRFQRTYFEGPPKPTMVPRPTPYLERHLDRMIEVAGLDQGMRILEVGCGMGRYTLPLRARGFKVEGQDLSPVLLERLREYAGNPEDLVLHAGDILDPLPEWQAAFDAVIGFFMLHHLHDVQGCLRGMGGMLKPGGRLAFLEPNPCNPLYHLQILGTPGMSYAGECSLFQMRRSVVLEAMAQGGLGQTRLHRFGFLPPILMNRPGGSQVETLLERFPLWGPLLPFQIFHGRAL